MEAFLVVLWTCGTLAAAIAAAFAGIRVGKSLRNCGHAVLPKLFDCAAATVFITVFIECGFVTGSALEISQCVGSLVVSFFMGVGWFSSPYLSIRSNS